MGVPQPYDPETLNVPSLGRPSRSSSVPDRATWRDTTLEQRAAVATRAAAILRERGEEFARSVMSDVGKMIDEARREVALGAEILEFYAETASAPAAREGRPLLFCVQPANCSYDQLARLSAPNLLAGNIVMIKHAGKVPQSALAFEQLWLEAGAPSGAYANLVISDD